MLIFIILQVGKGRDVGLNQIALFEGKVAGGNGEQVLSRDVYRLGQHFDFFRMLSFYYTTVGFYFCTMVGFLSCLKFCAICFSIINSCYCVHVSSIYSKKIKMNVAKEEKRWKSAYPKSGA